MQVGPSVGRDRGERPNLEVDRAPVDRALRRCRWPSGPTAGIESMLRREPLTYTQPFSDSVQCYIEIKFVLYYCIKYSFIV